MKTKFSIFQGLFKIMAFLFLIPKLALANNISDNMQLTGIWSGTIGSSKITVCFKDEHTGFYYYNRYGYPITIEKIKSNNTVFHETNGDWIIHLEGDKKISGSWILTKGQKTIKIELQKIKSNNNSELDCSDEAFVGRIIKNITEKNTKTKLTNIIDAQYITVSLPSTENFSVRVLKLTGDSPVVNKINSILKPEQNLSFNVDSMKECIAFSLLAGDAQVVYDDSHAIVGNYLNIHSNSNSNYCDTNYRIAHGESRRTINMKTGESENLISWFKDSETNDGDPVRLSDELLAFIFDRLDHLPSTVGLTSAERKECYADPGSDIMLSILSSGFKFELPPTSNYSCGESIDISFKELRPFLNTYGIQSIQAIESIQR